MFQIDDSTAAAVEPTPAAAGTPGYFTDGNPALGIPATIVSADWLNSITDELIALLSAAGITPAKATRNQVLAAINYLIKAGTAYRYPVPLIFGYGSSQATPAAVADTPVMQFAKTIAQSASWSFPITAQIDITKPVKLRLHFTGTVGAGNFYLQLGYQVFNAGALSPASYTNLSEAVAAPAVAGDVAEYLTAVAEIPAVALVATGLINCVLTRLATNVLDTNTGSLQLINVTLEQ
ncbi:MAG: hypothetical protein KGL39_57530 [Patescibacteria group bacterium]|nr:hypothetical protein [Patescibacteria group bacterium]